jgi:hypothetical protein
MEPGEIEPAVPDDTTTTARPSYFRKSWRVHVVLLVCAGIGCALAWSGPAATCETAYLQPLHQRAGWTISLGAFVFGIAAWASTWIRAIGRGVPVAVQLAGATFVLLVWLAAGLGIAAVWYQKFFYLCW